MLGITEKYNQFKKSTYFAGGKFVIYAACVYLAATFAAGCLGAVIGFPLLTFPLAMLISNPVVWVLMGVVLTAAYKMVVKPLFHLAKDYINKKKAPEGEKSEEKEVEPQKSPEKQEQTVANQERPKTPGRDSGIFECEKDKNSFLYRTENGDYKYHLSTTDIIDIAESKYRWIGYIDRKGLKDTSQGVYFTCPDNLESSLHGQLKKYKSQQEGKNLIFTSILNLNGNHWVTLVVAYNPNSVSRAYYCDSFGKDLPNEILDALQKTLKMGRNNIRISKEKQQEDDYNCGIFALENAHRITQMFNENKSSDEIKRELSEYKPNEEELKNKRIEFAKVLEKYKRSGVNMPDSQRKSRRSSVASGDSGLGSKKFHENLDTLVHQTNRGNYTYWLQQHDIAHIARAVYNYSESSDGDIFFCIPGNLESLSERLREYKNEPEREDTKSIFTSVINLGGNHWVTLVVAYNSNNKQFRAYYCDSFSANLPSPGSKRSSIKLANEIKDKLIVSLTNQASELSAQDKKEMGKDVQKTAQTCRDKKNELVNVPINTDNMVSALEEVLKIENCNIRSSGAKQQSDGHNCGIFALENAHKITQMFNEGKSFYEIDKELSEYKFDLNEKRREFAEALMNDQEWKKDLESGFLCELPPRTKASSTSEVQHTGSFCNIT